MKLLLPLLVLSMTVALVMGTPSVSAQSTAPAKLSLEYQACQEDGTVSVSFLWFPGDARWLDVSQSSSFQGWSNARLTPGQNKHFWEGLGTSNTYYARVSSPGPDGWLRSNTVEFTTPACNLPISPNGAKNLSAGNQLCSGGQARVSFGWTRYVSDEWHNQWLDYSRDPDFRGWSNINLGIGARGISGVRLEPDTTYYVRISTYAGDGVWWWSGLVTFHTLACK